MPSVIVNTSVWVDYLRGTQSARTDALDRLLEVDEAAICGVIEAELVAGLRNPKEREELVSLLDGCDYLDVGRADCRRTGELAGQLRDRGRALPLSDLVIAALAIDHGCSLLTSDSHFAHIPGVRLLTP